jgi:hypothetical protein
MFKQSALRSVEMPMLGIALCARVIGALGLIGLLQPGPRAKLEVSILWRAVTSAWNSEGERC